MAYWRLCSSCRSEIELETMYWECSVSTCARVAKTGLFFCSVGCWEAHLPTMRHREAWAVEKRAPSPAEWRQMQAHAEERDRPVEPARRVVATSGGGGEPTGQADEDEILIVVSKLKKYVRARSGMNTSDGVMAVLSAHLRKVCDLAIRKAGEEGRKTILDRDFKAIL